MRPDLSAICRSVKARDPIGCLMSDPFTDPHAGLPVRAEAVEPPGTCAPVSRRFPDLGMPALAAAIDLGIVVALILGWEAMLLVSDLPAFLAERWPSFGRLGTNILIGSFNLALVVAVLVIRRQSAATIGLGRPRVGHLVSATAIAIPACWVGSISGALLYTALVGLDTNKVLADKTELFDLVAQFPAAWILPFSLFVGIHEEVLFRGFFLSRLRAVSHSNAVAIIVTGMVFGLMHFYQGLLGIFQTTMIGLFLAIVVTYSRTLWPAIIAHAAFDATNMLIMPWVLRMAKELQYTA
jgi:uncharacterized protein